MQVYLITMGSLGDTLPFVHIGEAMAARGHNVTLIANQFFQPLIESRGLHFRTAMSRERYVRFVDKRRSGDQLGSVLDMSRLMVEQTEPIFRLLEEQYIPGQTVVCGQAYGVGARIAQEKLGIPLATAHLQPLWMRSDYEIPRLPPWLARSIGPTLNRTLDLLADRFFGKPIMAFRQSHGLPPERRFMRYWWNSPQCVLGLFPDWFVAPQPDWPRAVLQPGFPLPPIESAEALPQRLRAFLDAGEEPIVFSQSSIASDARRYFETSLDIAGKLRRRAVFLTPNADVVPESLPDDVHYEANVSLDLLLPRSLVHVHHGGMGMIAHSLRAGIPQVTIPGIFDQPDNAARLQRLGVSCNIEPRKYRRDGAIRGIQDLLGSADVQNRCRDYADRIRRTNPLAICCDALEALAEGRSIFADRPVAASSRLPTVPRAAAGLI